MIALWLILVSIQGLASSVVEYDGGHRDVFIAGFLPYNESSAEFTAVSSAVDIAIEQINKSPHILPKYTLNILWNFTQCNPGVGLKAFFDMIHERPKKIFLLGATCSSVTDIIAKAAKHWDLIQLSYSDTHPMFTEKGYPNFFRIIPSENVYNHPRLSLMRYYNWTRVGTLYQDKAKFSLAHNKLVSDLERNKFEVVESQSFNDELTDQLDLLVGKDVRIILGNFEEPWARKVFCYAFHKGVYGWKFQWIIVGMYSAEWWTKDQGLNCTAQQIMKALNGTLIMEMITLASDDNITTVSGMTSLAYKDEYTRRTTTTSPFHGYAFDGTFTLALAIHEVDKIIPVTQFEYNNKTWYNLFMNALERTSFEGVTGPVRFKGNSRRGNIVIKQIREVNGTFSSTCVGEYSGVTRTLHMEKCAEVEWPKGRAPKDRTIKRIEPSRIHPTVFLITVGIAGFGIVLALAFLAFNLKFRHERQIKMSSPNMNNIIIIGCILTYISVILLGLDSNLTSKEAFPYICTARAWILMSGFTLSFGSMFSKTWRVHSIFTNVQLNKKVMKDYQLYLVVAALVLIDLITMTTWQIIDPFYRETKELVPFVSNDDETLIIPKIEYCRSDHMTIFVGCIYGYKGLLMLFGAFLAWETRQVQIPALNDSKYVGISVYNVTIMCVLGAAVSFVLSEEQTASYIIISAFIIFCNTGTLSLVFVPKIIDMRRDPYAKGAKVGKPTMKTMGVAKFNNKPVQSVEDMLRIAKRVNEKLRNSIIEVEKEIQNAQKVAEEIKKAEQSHTLHPERAEVNKIATLEAKPGGDSQPAVRQSTTSTITSDYFSGSSKEHIPRHNRALRELPRGNQQTEEIKRNASLEDQATQTDDEDFLEYRPLYYRQRVEIDKFATCRSHDELMAKSVYWSPVKLKNQEVGDAIEEIRTADLSSQMLPIFQRLIEDKKAKSNDDSSKTKSNTASCPDITLKCDIVEYL